MNKQQILIIALAMMASVSLVNACPLTIINDQPQDIMVIDPHTGKEIHIKGKSWLGVKSEGTLEPSQGIVAKWFVNKRLVVKVKGNDNVYRPMYEVKQRKCSTMGEIVLTMSDIKKLVKQPTDLLEAKEITSEAQATQAAKQSPKKVEAKKKAAKKAEQSWYQRNRTRLL